MSFSLLVYWSGLQKYIYCVLKVNWIITLWCFFCMCVCFRALFLPTGTEHCPVPLVEASTRCFVLINSHFVRFRCLLWRNPCQQPPCCCHHWSRSHLRHSVASSEKVENRNKVPWIVRKNRIRVHFISSCYPFDTNVVLFIFSWISSSLVYLSFPFSAAFHYDIKSNIS